MNKNCLTNARLNRYHYKTNHSSITHPTNSHQNQDQQLTNKK